MKSVIGFLITILMCCGCFSSVKSKRPSLGTPTLEFQYFKNNVWVKADGHSAEYFKPGDPKKFKFTIPSGMPGCKFRYIDGDTDTSTNCKSGKELVLDFGIYYKKHPSVIGFSVGNRLKSVVGYFYPTMGKPRQPLSVDFSCPKKSTRGGLSVCSRPATYPIKIKVSTSDNYAGKFFYTSKCGGYESKTKTEHIGGPAEFIFEVGSDKVAYCAIGVGLIQGYGKKRVNKAHIIHVRFYDPE